MALAPKQRKQPIPPQPTPFPSRQGAAAAAAAALRVDILRGRVAAGARLEIDEIAARHGLSRTRVRDALKQLEAEGRCRCCPIAASR